MIYVVGIGPGNPNLLTSKAIEIFKKSEVVIGGKRNIELFQGVIEKREGIEYANEKKIESLHKEYQNYKIEEYYHKVQNQREFFYLESNFSRLYEYVKENIEKSILILASGDPKIYGISDYIAKNFSDKVEIEVISGVSSIQYAFSKIDINMNDLYITSSHGRMPNFDFIFMHDKIALVTDKKVGPREICSEVISRGLDYYIYVCENLSYDNEKIYKGKAKDFINDKVYDLAVVILVRCKDEE